MQISGNTIFIPGATSGIGLALALRLQDAGNTVVIGGRRTDVLDRLAAEFGFGTITVDISDAASVLNARDAVLAASPDLVVLIAMAGIMVPEDVTTADFLDTAERTIDTNVLGPVRLVAAFIEHLQTRSDATIMTVSSGLAHTPLRITPSYNASKAFIHQFTESIRLQLAGTSVQVVELVPPAVRTELMPGGSHIEAFLPLDDYVEETMALLAQPAGRHRNPRRARQAAALLRGERRPRADDRDGQLALTAVAPRVPAGAGRPRRVAARRPGRLA